MAYDKPVSRRTSIETIDIATTKRTDGLPEQLVCGFMPAANAEEHIRSRLIDSFQGLAALPCDDVIYFDDTEKGNELAEVFFINAALIGVKPVILKGYPAATETAHFEQLAWSFETAPYADLVADLTTAARIDRLRDNEAGARQKKPRRDQVLDRDRTKHYSGFQQIRFDDENGKTDDGVSDEISSR